MLSLVFDPAAFGGAEAFSEDVRRLAEWTKSTPPIVKGGKVYLPGELEEQTRLERQVHGLPVDDETWRRIVSTATSLGVEIPKTIIAMRTHRRRHVLVITARGECVPPPYSPVFK